MAKKKDEKEERDVAAEEVAAADDTFIVAPAVEEVGPPAVDTEASADEKSEILVNLSEIREILAEPLSSGNTKLEQLGRYVEKKEAEHKKADA